mgnify:CR=1 FL=1
MKKLLPLFVAGAAALVALVYALYRLATDEQYRGRKVYE